MARLFIAIAMLFVFAIINAQQSYFDNRIQTRDDPADFFTSVDYMPNDLPTVPQYRNLGNLDTGNYYASGTNIPNNIPYGYQYGLNGANGNFNLIQ